MKSLASCFIVAGASTCLSFGEPSLTIYNQNFAVVRDAVPLSLKAGTNEVRFAGATAHVEPDSVILRDPAGKFSLQVLEQNYRNDPVSEELLLSLNEGKTIDFERERWNGNAMVPEIISGKIVRSGYVPHYAAMSRYGQQYYQTQMAYASSSGQPIIEVDGKLRFSLPGRPLFPDLGDDTVLKPSFNWVIQADKAGEVEAEVGYVTGGFTWSADYNLVASETGDYVDLIGWVTMDNQSGKTVRDARIKLMAGDVRKIRDRSAMMGLDADEAVSMSTAGASPAATEKAFDEFHLYTLARSTTLRDRETKQVEFVRAEHILAPVIYIYDGAPGMRYQGGRHLDRGYGKSDDKKIEVEREFVNAGSNHLGIPLPAGKLRFYRSNDDKQLEFTGEDTIDHTPKDETIHVTTGSSFDLVGERKQTAFKVDKAEKWMDESFQIKLRNHKATPVTVHTIEPLYRENNWEITDKSDDFTKKDSHTIEFDVPVAPDQEKVVTYTVHYSW